VTLQLLLTSLTVSMLVTTPFTFAVISKEVLNTAAVPAYSQRVKQFDERY
jgi:ABC-type arginine/histidine transport system permease subunit